LLVRILKIILSTVFQQPVEINRTEEEIYRMYESYSEFLQIVKSGSSTHGSRFLEDMETLKELVKDEPKYVNKIDTIIALWNS
jgi:hypothetical protein